MASRPTFRLAAGALAAVVAVIAAILSTWHDRKEQSLQVLTCSGRKETGGQPANSVDAYA